MEIEPATQRTLQGIVRVDVHLGAVQFFQLGQLDALLGGLHRAQRVEDGAFVTHARDPEKVDRAELRRFEVDGEFLPIERLDGEVG